MLHKGYINHWKEMHIFEGTLHRVWFEQKAGGSNKENSSDHELIEPVPRD
jgi:hypothetical protein